MDDTIIVECAGGYVQYRLTFTGEVKVEMREFICVSREEIIWTKWLEIHPQNGGKFLSTTDTWLHIGNLLGLFPNKIHNTNLGVING